MTKAPFGRAATAEAEGIGGNPADRGKHGTKRSILSDGHGLPLVVVIAGANRTDMKLLAPTLDALVLARPDPTPEQRQGVCLDKGYEYDVIRDQLDARGYTPHIRPIGEDTVYARSLDPTKTPRGWVVECLHS